jgi:hypothetical protein
MKINYIILLVGLLIGNIAFANEEFEFTDDCIDVFIKLNKSSFEFYTIIENSTDPNELKNEITNYNNDLVLFSLNKLSKYTKSDNLVIKAVADDLSNAITDLVKLNYEYLNFLTNSEFNKRKLKKKSETLVKQSKLISNSFKGIAQGIQVLLLKPQPDKTDDKLYIQLTLNQRDLLNEKLANELDTSIVENNMECECKTSFEHASRLILMFINLDWEFEKE